MQCVQEFSTRELLKFLGADVSEGPLEEMGIHSFIYVCRVPDR